MEDIENKILAQRREALSEIDEMMLRSFEEIGEWMCNDASATDLKKSDISGYTQNSLRMIMEHYEAGDLSDWLFGDRYYRNLVEFLGLSQLRTNDSQKRFPNAFRKWSEEEERILLEGRRNGASYSSLSATMGRNVHALRLRMEHILARSVSADIEL